VPFAFCNGRILQHVTFIDFIPIITCHDRLFVWRLSYFLQEKGFWLVGCMEFYIFSHSLALIDSILGDEGWLHMYIIFFMYYFKIVRPKKPKGSSGLPHLAYVF
jgi:hypothetical protein